MEAGFIEEEGARFVINTLTPGQGTIFPKGSIHYQINTGCDTLTFVASLNDEDPGVNQIAQGCKFQNGLYYFEWPLTTGLDSLRSPT